MKATVNRKVKGLRFISHNQALINVIDHAEIMDDAIDRILIKEARNDERIPWEKVKEKLLILKGTQHDLQNRTNKKSRKKSIKGR